MAATALHFLDLMVIDCDGVDALIYKMEVLSLAREVHQHIPDLVEAAQLVGMQYFWVLLNLQSFVTVS